MRLITTTEKTAEIFGDEESVRILAEAGFDAIDGWRRGHLVYG